MSTIENKLSNYRDNMVLYTKLFNDTKGLFNKSIQEIDSFLGRKDEVRSIKVDFDCIVIEYKNNEVTHIKDKHSVEIITEIIKEKNMVSYGVLSNDRFEKQLFQSLGEKYITENLSSIISRVDTVSMDNSTNTILLKYTEAGDEVVHSFNDKSLKEAVQVCIKKNIIKRGDTNVNSY